MSRIRSTVRMVAVVAAVGALVGAPAPAPAPGRALGFVVQDGAASADALIERMLTAFEAADLDALHALRVTEAEYRAMVAWSVPPGERPRVLRPEVQDYAWQLLDTKSRHYESYLIDQYGGRRYRVTAVRFGKGMVEYAGYRAHRQLRLVLDERGTDVDLATGSIVEVDGRFKFASFIRD